MRLIPAITAAVLAVVVMIGVFSAPISAERSRPPKADVVALDGDTIELHGKVIDLYGIDAPELGQLCVSGKHVEPCGLQAAYALQKLIDTSIDPIECSPVEDEDEDDVCRAGTDDMAHTLLVGGYVIAAKETSPGYHDAEETAKKANLGLWRMDFVSPADWREGKRLPAEKKAGNEACKVKGVVTATGAKIYYVPTDQGYDSIVSDPVFGGKLMCSEEFARLNGWRRP
jgi:endonuclease YncB( thermonuclease family)